jgi:hypothetical protein
MIEPFTGTVVREQDFVDPVTKAENRYRNANRAKQQLFMYSRSNEWDWFLTWTFDPRKVKSRYDYDECYKRIENWIKSQRKKYAKELKYLIVPEMHKDGAWHFHGLLADCGNIRFSDSGLFDKKGRKIFNLSGFRSGWTTATQVGSAEKASAYLMKYATKDMLCSLEGKHRYLRSRNLAEPSQYTTFCENEKEFNDYLSIYCDSVGKKVAHVKKTQAENVFTQVTYIELN